MRLTPDTGNTRTGLGKEKARSGGVKGLEYRFTSIALANWAHMSRNPALEPCECRLFEADHNLRANQSAFAWDGC